MTQRVLAALAAVLLCSAEAGAAPASSPASASPLFAAALRAPEGRVFDMAALRGQPLLVNFWARWCEPCRREIPLLAAAARGEGASGVRVLGIAIDDNLESVKDFARAYHMDYDVLLAGEQGAALMQALGNAAATLPYTLSIDAAGVIVGRHRGELDASGMSDALQRSRGGAGNLPQASLDELVSRLGALAGEALACRNRDAQEHARSIMLTYVPKTQHYGQLYEETTRRGYLDSLRAAKPCGSGVKLLAEVDGIRAALPAPAPADSDAAAAPALALTAAAAPGEEAPAVSLRFLLSDVQGHAVTDEDFRGKYLLVTFGYTSCPDVCPTTLTTLGSVMKGLGERAAGVNPVFITVDPARDTAEHLRAYLGNFDPRIRGLTGSEELVRSAANHFHADYRRTADRDGRPGSYGIDHTAGFFLVSPEGELRGHLAFDAPVPELVHDIEREMDAAPAEPGPRAQ